MWSAGKAQAASCLQPCLHRATSRVAPRADRKGGTQAQQLVDETHAKMVEWQAKLVKLSDGRCHPPLRPHLVPVSLVSSPRLHPPPPSRHTLARKDEKGESKGTGTQEAMGHGWHTQHVLTAQHVLTHTTHTRPDADKSKEKMMQEKLEREKLNGEKDVAQSNYGTETTAYNQVLLACLSSTLFSACAQLGVRECPVPSARARAGGSGRTKHLTCVSE